MIGPWMLAIATFATAPEPAPTEMTTALATIQRLAAAVPPLKPNATVQERAEYRPAKAELEAMVNYLGKACEVMAIGKFNEKDRSNMLTAARQTVQTGQFFSVLPEEALVWERAGLNFAATHLREVRRQVAAGMLPTSALDTASLADEFARKRYNEALARCLTASK